MRDISDIQFEFINLMDQNSAPGFPRAESLASAFDTSNPFQNGPFGYEDIPIVQEKGTTEATNAKVWYYEVVRDSNAVKLIEEYSSDRSLNVVGSSSDKHTDIRIYYESSDIYNLFGSICFVRLNIALKSFVTSGKFHNSKWLAEQIAQNHRQNLRGFVLNEKLIEEAINYELQVDGSNLVGDAVRRLLKVSMKTPMDLLGTLLFTEKHWNPELTNYDPPFASILLKKGINKWNTIRKNLLNYAQDFRSFGNKLGKNIHPFYGSLVMYVADFIAMVIEAIDSLVDLVRKTQKSMELSNAFLCGVFNSLIETVSGILELMLLAVDITDKKQRDAVLEIIENVIEQYRKNPNKIIQDVQKAGEELIERYSNKKHYRIAYHLGEDAVVVLSIVEGVAAISRIIAKASKSLRGWIERMVRKQILDRNKALEEVAEKAKLRKSAYKDFVQSISKENLDYLIEHLFEGHIKVKKFKKLKFSTATGVHSMEAVQSGKVR